MRSLPRTFTVAGLSARLDSETAAWKFPEGDPTPLFLSDGEGQLRLAARSIPREEFDLDLAGAQAVAGFWLFRQDRSRLTFLLRRINGEPLAAIAVDEAFQSGEALFNRECARNAFPLGVGGEMLYAHWLARRNGLLLHAASFLAGGRAVVALGHSGDGKSTLAAYWADAFGKESVLTDERTVLRTMPGGGLWAFGTPWQGSGGFGQPKGAPAALVVTLRQEAEHALCPKSTATLAADLLGHLLLPPWDRATMAHAAEAAAEIARQCPAAEFAFRRDPGAAEALARALDVRPGVG